MNIRIKECLSCCGEKYLATCVSAIVTSVICMSFSTYASDIEIYQKPTAGNITLMLMLDISGSMGSATPTAPTTNGYSFVDDYGLTTCGIVNQTDTVPDFVGNSSALNNKVYSESSNTSPAYRRNFCYVTASNATQRIKDNCELQSNKAYRCYDRLTKLKDGLFDLLQGNSTKGITKLSDDKVIGLSAFSYLGNSKSGYILVPARRLDAFSGTQSQRNILLNNIASLTALQGTPTANAYADVAAYLLGTTTYDPSEINKQYYFQNSSSNYRECYIWNSNGTCTGQGWRPNGEASNSYAYWYGGTSIANLPGFFSGLIAYTGSTMTIGTTSFPGTLYVGGENNIYSGFRLSVDSSKNASNYIKPDSLNVDTSKQQCSGQGIYVLTDGAPNGSSNTIANNLMKRALSSKASNFSCSNSKLVQVNKADGGDAGGAWQCIGNFAETLLDEAKNPGGLKLKTAVVGFGSAFNGIVSYSKNLSQAQNIANINSSSASEDQKNAARWGVYGEGGWYSGSNSEDVVNSVNEFLGNLAVDIPAVTTGTATIPIDQLNTVALQKYAYYPQFEPTPDKNYQSWVGNLKRYNIALNGQIVDIFGKSIVTETGRLKDNYDLWSDYSSNMSSEQKAAALIGGVKNKLELRKNNSGKLNRIIFTNRNYALTDHQENKLNQITIDYLDDSSKSDLIKTDPDRGYLIALLGYAVDATQPEKITADTLKNTDELRQLGAVMHSSPLLITNQGKITYTNNEVSSEDRKDYVLFGTTQGLLHVVDAETGKEKFAFVPNEMIENQKEAFLKPESTSGGIEHLYYGVDAPWVGYSEYVLADNDLLTVGKGKYGNGMQMVYGGLRMGGKSYYALDLSNIHEEGGKPILKFQINPTGTCTSSNPLGCMGQSWSKPTITWVNWNGEKKRVMLVGGGYDAQGDGSDATKNTKDKYKGYEYDDYNQTSKIGAGVYMFDADNGGLLWWASANATDSKNSTHSDDLKYSVVSQIKAIDRNLDGLTDHLYFGDLGGQVWRIDLNNNVGKNTALFARTPTRILNLHNSLNPAASPRFYEAPAFSTYVADGKIFAVVSIGSGNRSKPLAEYDAGEDYKNDGIYNIYDKDVTRSDLFTLNEEKNAYLITSTDLFTQNISLQTESNVSESSINKLYPITDLNRFSNTIILANQLVTSGWYYLFEGNKIQTRKVMFTPIVINNDMYVTTFDASKAGLSGDCGAGVKGESFATLFCMPYGQCSEGYITGSSSNNTEHSNNTEKSLGAGIVGINILPGGGGGGNRIILGKEYSAKLKLIPQRWYEKYK
nr:PilC/PilY family type IV pilus protein [Acinetobacter sp. Marseille-Q1620]